MAALTDRQLQACLSGRVNMVVKACAGSGKTHLLTSRIIRLLFDEPKLQAGQILAITYTNAAVAEIEQRISERLRQMQKASDAELDGLLGQLLLEPSAPARQRARGLYHRFVFANPTMTITTFHGWFNQINEDLPWSERPSLSTKVASNDVILRLFAWRRALAAAAQDPPLGDAFAELFRWHSHDAAQEVLDALLEQRVPWLLCFGQPLEDADAAGRFMASFDQQEPRPPQPEELLGAPVFATTVAELAERVRELAGVKPPKYLADFGTALAGFEPALPEPLAQIEAALYTQAGKVRKHLTNKFSGPGMDSLLQFGQLVSVVEQCQRWYRWRRARAYNLAAVTAGCAYARAYEQIKKEQGVIDYPDMELGVLRMLARPDSDAFIKKLDATYRHILIDEFQDTSPSQWKVVHEWLEAVHSSDNQPSVFIVGDPKQSIFGFQGGDPQVLELAERYLHGDDNHPGYGGQHGIEPTHLNSTRRCSAQVVSVVNEVFSQRDEEFALLPGFERHDTLQDAPGSVEVIERSDLEQDSRQARRQLRNPLVEAAELDVDNPAQLEGEQIAARLSQIIGRWQITGDDGQPRACRPDDVMILYPSRAGASLVAQAVTKAGIGCAQPAAQNRLASLECQDIIALLQAIYDPRNALAVAHTLRSPVFGVSDADLQAVHEAGMGSGRFANWHRGLRKATGSAQLALAQKLLASWRRAYTHGKLPAHETLARCYHDVRIIDRYEHSVPAELRSQVVANLEWLLNYAIEADGGRHAQLADFVEHLHDMALLKRLGDDDIDATGLVRTSTVHSAKGRESPVVVMSNSHARVRGDSHLLVGWQSGASGLREPNHISFVRAGEDMLELQRQISETNTKERRREHYSLLYVAMTRARNALVVSSKPARRRDSRQLDWHDRIAVALRREARSGQMPVAARPPPKAGAESPAAKLLEAKEHGHEKPYPSQWERHGTLLHDLLAMHLAGVTDATTQRSFLGVSAAELDRLREQAGSILAGQRFAGLLARASSIEVELPIADEEGRIRRIDCLLEVDGALWVIDFKSTSQPGSPEHRQQLRDYRAALASRSQGRPINLALIGGQGELVEVD